MARDSLPESIPLPVKLLAQSPFWDGLDGGMVVVACSGGRDSVALALAAAELLHSDAHASFRTRFSLTPRLMLWHLDHQLRPDSATDRNFVEDLSHKISAGCILESVDLTAIPGFESENTEELARRERYRRLMALVGSGSTHFPDGKIAVLTAHHLGDQVETILHHIVRGTHLPGLRGISPVRDGIIHRPWLALHPGEITKYLNRRGQSWMEDPTNLDTRLTRNKLRHDVIPKLLSINPRAMEHISRLAGLASVALELTHSKLDELETSFLDAASLARNLPVLTPEGIEYEVHFAKQGWDDPVILEAYVQTVVEKLFGGLPSSFPASLNEWARDTSNALAFNGLRLALLSTNLLELQSTRPDPYTISASITGTGKAMAGNRLLTVDDSRSDIWHSHHQRTVTPPEKVRRWTELLGWCFENESSPVWRCFLPSSITPGLILRTLKPGDRFNLPQGGSKKLGDMFTDAKVPVCFRHAWPVLTDSLDRILWVPGLGHTRDIHMEAGDQPARMVTLTHGR